MCIQSDLGRIQSDLGRIQLGLGRIQSDWLVGLEGKISIGALDIFNGGVKNPMRVLKRVNGGIEKIRRGYCVGSMGALGALVRQWGHWKGSMGHWSGSMGVLVSIGQGYWKGSMGALVSVNGVLKRVNGGIGQGQWGRLKRVRSDRGLALGQAGVWLWVRQGCGCGSDRRLSYRVVSSTLQGCKLYLAGL